MFKRDRTSFGFFGKLCQTNGKQFAGVPVARQATGKPNDRLPALWQAAG
jgi:hypothetical protein